MTATYQGPRNLNTTSRRRLEAQGQWPKSDIQARRFVMVAHTNSSTGEVFKCQGERFVATPIQTIYNKADLEYNLF